VPKKQTPARRTNLSVVAEDPNDDVQLAKAALALKRRGKSYADIANALGLSSAAAASGIVRNVLADAARLVSDASKAEMMTEELMRLDALQDAAWDQAMTGDTRSLEAVLKVMSHRAKLLGLEASSAIDVRNQTVVVANDPQAYVDSLRRIISTGGN
jgi:hypothetical protein